MNKTNKKRLTTFILIVVGLGLSIYLIGGKQIFKSKAAVSSLLEITQGGEQPRPEVSCNGDVCTTNSLDIYIRPKSLGDQPDGPIKAVIIAPTPKAVPISSCTFTRGKDEGQIRSSRIANWVTEAAREEGIPPSIMASLAYHEGKNLVTKDDSDPAIQSNSYCNYGEWMCLKSGRVVHYDQCTEDEKKTGAQSARAVGLIQVIDIYGPPGVNLCNISENIKAAADTFLGKMPKDEAGNPKYNDEISVRKAACRFYGIDGLDCTYGPYNYGEEVWDDYQDCPGGY